MSVIVLQDRLTWLDGVSIRNGSHDSIEAVASFYRWYRHQLRKALQEVKA